MEKSLPSRQEVRYATADLVTAVRNIEVLTYTVSGDYVAMLAAAITLQHIANDLLVLVQHGGTWSEIRKNATI